MKQELAKAGCEAAEAAGKRILGLYYDIDELNARLADIDLTPRPVHMDRWVRSVKINDVQLWRVWEIEQWIIDTAPPR